MSIHKYILNDIYMYTDVHTFTIKGRYGNTIVIVNPTENYSNVYIYTQIKVMRLIINTSCIQLQFTLKPIQWRSLCDQQYNYVTTLIVKVLWLSICTSTYSISLFYISVLHCLFHSIVTLVTVTPCSKLDDCHATTTWLLTYATISTYCLEIFEVWTPE